MFRLLLIFALALGHAGVASAEEHGSPVSKMLPQLPPATGEPHPEGNEFWRARHMELLSHDRDKTLREGERDIQASLKECFVCHQAKDENGTPVTADSPKQFCRVCHDFVGVKVDCFVCHRSTPDGVDEEALRAGGEDRADMVRDGPDLEELFAYLDGLTSPEMAQTEGIGE